jgi:hypothetical protein
MQEAPNEPAARKSPYRNRLQVLIYATLIPAISATIWLLAIISQADSQFNSIIIELIIGMTVIGASLGAAAIKIPHAVVDAKIEKLLTEFVQVSDKFTRPKAYVHKALVRTKTTPEPKDFIHHFHAYSDGILRMPEMTSEQAPKGEGTYVVCINMDDEIWDLYDGQRSPYQDDEFLSRTRKHYKRALKVLYFRIKDRWPTPAHNPRRPKVIEGDFIAEGTEADAFLKTMELSRLFKKNTGFSSRQD